MPPSSEQGDSRQTSQESEGPEIDEPPVEPPIGEVPPIEPPTSEVPHPPYDENTPYGGDHKLRCFFQDCATERSTYLSMGAHIKIGHGVKPTHWGNSYFLNKFNEENTIQQQVYRSSPKKLAEAAAKKAARAAEAKRRSGSLVKRKTQKKEPAGALVVASTTQSGDLEQLSLEPSSKKPKSQFQWVVRECFVKATLDGEVVEPLQAFGLAGPDAPQPPGLEGQDGVCDALAFDSEQSAIATCLVGNAPGVSSSASSDALSQILPYPGPREMMAEMYQGFKTKQQSELAIENWQATVPKVRVKQSFLDQDPPKAKREGVGRATWPKVLEKDKVELVDFKVCLQRNAKGAAHIASLVLNAGRALGTLQIGAAAIDGETVDMADAKVLVGLYLSEQYYNLLEAPLLHPKYGWAEDILEGLVNYAVFWTKRLEEMRVKADRVQAEILARYKTSLGCLIDKLTDGYSKRFKEYKEIGYSQKREEDRHVLKHFPSFPDLIQPSLRLAYCLLKQLCSEYADKAEVPPRIRGVANAIIAGAWSYDTYMGRKWEIEHALYETVAKALAELDEYILCRFHKTWKTYGDIIKLLTPGLFEALVDYKRLPRPPGCKYFLVPATAKAETVSIPTSLKTFNRNCLKGAKVSPTTNHLRKLFHKELMKLTKNEDAMKDFMTVMDAHGRKVQDKHYIIKDPEDDLACAKVLVEKVLIKTVDYPTQEEADGAGSLEELLASFKAEKFEEAGEGAEEEDDPGAELLEPWPFGASFGVKEGGKLNVLALQDAPASLGPNLDSQMVVAFREEGDTAKEKKSKQKDSKKEKRRQKEAEEAKEEQEAEQLGDKERWAQFPHNKNTFRQRTPVDPPTRIEIQNALVQWQQENGKTADERPLEGPWYWNLRCDLIEARKLTCEHSWDVCRSIVRDFLKRQEV